MILLCNQSVKYTDNTVCFKIGWNKIIFEKESEDTDMVLGDTFLIIQSYDKHMDCCLSLLKFSICGKKTHHCHQVTYIHVCEIV